MGLIDPLCFQKTICAERYRIYFVGCTTGLVFLIDYHSIIGIRKLHSWMVMSVNHRNHSG